MTDVEVAQSVEQAIAALDIVSYQFPFLFCIITVTHSWLSDPHWPFIPADWSRYSIGIEVIGKHNDSIIKNTPFRRTELICTQRNVSKQLGQRSSKAEFRNYEQRIRLWDYHKSDKCWGKNGKSRPWIRWTSDTPIVELRDCESLRWKWIFEKQLKLHLGLWFL